MLMETPDQIVGHNIIGFDIPVIQKLYPWFSIDEKKVIDTIVLSRLICSNMYDLDGPRDIPPKMKGSHSLESWGYRLGVMKGEYADWYKQQAGETYQAGDEWKEFCQEMLDYCVQDVAVTEAVYKNLTGRGYSQQAIDLEHEVRWICTRMEHSGWPFDVKAAVELYADLVQKRDAIRKQMLDTFEPLVIKRVSEKTGKTLKDKIIEFNPGSRDQIAYRLTEKYGWKPTEFTPAGKPKVDEEVLATLEYPEAKVLSEYFLLEKRIGQLSEGSQGWLKTERNGYLHGSINTNGAVTGRCTHSKPNLAQVPAVRSPYGKECRSLYRVQPGFRMVGADLSGLELRALAHFMHRWDSGEYGDVVLNGDVHTMNQKAADLPTRDNAKTFIYGFLYGAGDEKIGSIIGKGRDAGKAIKQKFLKGLPALKKLKDAVGEASKRGYLKGIDGRHLHVRSAHSALNLLLQSAGALASKRWLIECIHEANRRGLKYGWDGDYTLLGYIHDELQWAVREDLAEEFGKFVVECARRAGDYFNFKCPLDAEYKIGSNWYETH
jgi:DNA polymerase I-like protein with 3'-5' exonuclease and polymerase domains